MNSISPEYDVVVIGGGPAGSTTSTLIAQQGRRVGLFERERFPRFHIGESLIPETYWVLKRLNMLPKMQQSHFQKKYSVQFVNASGKLSAPFYFWDNKPHECSQTWQVVRSEFDKMMLDNAREHGVDAHEGVHVLDVLFEGDRAVGVRVKDAQGERREIRASVVVDASGQAALLQNRFKFRLWDPILNKGAIWTYWEGAYRDTGRDEGATMVLQTVDKKGWFWYIPQHDNIVSVGVVAPFDYLFKGRESHEKTYEEEVERCPAVKQRVSPGRRVTGYFVTRDYSYRSTTAAQLGGWGPMFNEGVDRMRRLVCEYYDGFSFGRFVREYPELRGTVTDLLIGDLFTNRVDKVWGPMETLYPPDKKPIPPWHAGLAPEAAGGKANELVLPDGLRP
jgi:hypothetical protein